MKSYVPRPIVQAAIIRTFDVLDASHQICLHIADDSHSNVSKKMLSHIGSIPFLHMELRGMYYVEFDEDHFDILTATEFKNRFTLENPDDR